MFSPPRLSGSSDKDKLAEIGAYLTRLANDLNIVLMNVGTSEAVLQKVNQALAAQGEKTVTESNWNTIKSLIIKSADIIEVYQEKISTELAGNYVAVSEFGTFVEKTNAQLEASSTGIEQNYSNIQQIELNISDIKNNVGGLTTNVQDISSQVGILESSLIEVNAHINTGLLYYDEYGIPVYGMEVGQRTEIDGVEVFNKYARFTADRLSFYDQNGNEVAYISDKKLYIAHVEVLGSMLMGGFKDSVQADGSIVTRWVGVS